MGRSKIYWIVVILGLIAAVSGIFMMRSAHSSLNYPGKIVGWTGIGLIFMARIFFTRRAQPQPTKPKS